MSALHPARGGVPFFPAMRAASVAALAGFELVALDSVYDVHALAGYAATDAWLWTNIFLKALAYTGLYAAGAFALIAWPKRQLLIDFFLAEAPQRWPLWVAINFTAFSALTTFTLSVRDHANGPPWNAMPIWLGGLAVLLSGAIAGLATRSTWRILIRRLRKELGVAGLAGFAIMAAAQLAQNSWNVLAGATLQLSYTILRFFDATAFVDIDKHELGASSYKVIVDSFCSGYEGVGMVVSALALFLYMFRTHFRFPRALWLLPIGAALIWLLNAGRIAAMVEIGAHISRGAALRGFHSQAGWILFVGVTVALMAWAHASPLFRADATPAQRNPIVRLASALLTPFAALMASRTIAAAFGVDAHWVAVCAIVLPTAVLWNYRDTLKTLLGKMDLDAIAIGVVVGVLWIATEPGHAASGLGLWVSNQGSAGAFLWLLLRVFGFAVIVPIAEELAFRGYLHSALSRARFEEARPAFNWTAFVATSLLFGLMHQRWLAGMLAGAIYALVLYRSKNIGGPIAAHMATNGLIAAYALIFSNWNLI